MKMNGALVFFVTSELVINDLFLLNYIEIMLY